MIKLQETADRHKTVFIDISMILTQYPKQREVADDQLTYHDSFKTFLRSRGGRQRVPFTQDEVVSVLDMGREVFLFSHIPSTHPQHSQKRFEVIIEKKS